MIQIKRNALKENLIALFWMTSSKKTKRFLEIDLLRGLAISLMVFGHILWDLDYFNIIPMNGFIYSTLQKIVPTLFFLLVGISIILSQKKKMLDKEKRKKGYELLFVRGFKIFNLGVILTIFSLIFLPARPVFFGVLHCIGFSIVLSIFFLKYKYSNLFLGLLFVIIGLYISSIDFANPSLFHLIIGLHQTNIWQYTVDYFPLLPWFGVTLIGMGIGDIMYDCDKRRFKLPAIALSNYRPAKAFSWAGRHSLEIYLIHQPILAGVIYVVMCCF